MKYETSELNVESDCSLVGPHSATYRQVVPFEPHDCIDGTYFQNLLIDFVLAFVRLFDGIDCRLLPVHSSVFLTPHGDGRGG